MHAFLHFYSLTLSGPGGSEAQMTKLTATNQPIRNLSFYNAQTWWLIIFILKTGSDQILAKLINQGVATALFSSKRTQNFKYEKIFLCLKIVKIDKGGQYWVGENDSGHKNKFFKS